MAKKDGSGWMKWVVLLLLLGGGAWGFVHWQRGGEKEPEYRTAVVASGDLTQAVTATGQLNPVVNVQVGSQVSGIINKLYVDFNSKVTNGQVVAQLDPATFKAARDQCEGDLESAKAALELSQLETKRADDMHKSKLISDSDNDKAVADLHQSKANVMIKQAALEQAQVNLDRSTIYAPIDGVVISRNVDVGQTVAASLSAPTLYVIANDLAKMQIDAAISEADVGGIEVNQQVNFTVDAFPYRTFHGTVVQVRNAAATNQNVVTYDTVIGVDNKDEKLKPGMTANVSVIIAQHEHVLKIPNAALRFRPADAPDPRRAGMTNGPGGMPAGGGGEGMAGGRGGGGGRGEGRGGPGGGGKPRGERSPTRTVYIMESAQTPDGKTPPLKPVQIKTGISDGALTEVTEGLKEGDVVVTGLNITSSPLAAPAANPFGGQQRRGF